MHGTVPAAGPPATGIAGSATPAAGTDQHRRGGDSRRPDVEQHFDSGEYSYSFSGLSGSLDHILVNGSVLDRSTGADIWNINSGESLALEYSRWNYHATDFHTPDPYRSSDHDPVVLGLLADAPPETLQLFGINDFHGRIHRRRADAAGREPPVGRWPRLRPEQLMPAPDPAGSPELLWLPG